MSILPLITFKAGRCDVDVCTLRPDLDVFANLNQTSSKPFKVTPDGTPGYLYLYAEDGMYSAMLTKSY
jgi:26S proteasome regulatory subunit N13